MSETRDVILVGAGVAGLAAAHELALRGYQTLTLEAEPEPGGRVRTARRAEARIELGAHVVTKAYSRTLELIDELGLRGDLVPVENSLRAAVRRDSRWHQVDYGSPLSVLRFGAIGARDKLSLLRAGAPAMRHARRLRYGDITTAASLDDAMVADRVSPAALGYYIGPLYEAFFGYRPEEVSYAVMALAMQSRGGRLLTLAGGMGMLSAKLAERVEVATGVRVEALRAEGDGVSLTARRADGSELALRAKGAIIATPATETVRLWAEAPPVVGEFLGMVRYSRADRVYLRTSERYLPSGRDLHMELIPQAERDGHSLALIEFMHQRADSGGLIYAEAAPSSGADRLSDEALADALQDEVERLHPDLREQITHRQVVRTDPMVPIFPVGHSRRLAAFREREAGPIELAGDYMSAPWIEGAIVSGETAAARLDSFIGSGS